MTPSISPLEPSLEEANRGDDPRGAEVHGFLRAMGADEVPHGQTTLYEHLVGTEAILRAWCQPLSVRRAGLLHSVYSTQNYPIQLVTWSQRAEVADLVGHEAERLAHLFCAIPPKRLAALISGASSSSEGMTLGSSRSPALREERLTRTDVSRLIVLRLANDLEQVCEADRGPCHGLSRLSSLACHLRGDPDAPPVFAYCSQAIADDAERRMIAAYREALEALPHDEELAGLRLAACRRECAWLGEPLVWVGYLALRRGDRERAGAALEEAAAKLRRWGTAWDKRLDISVWLWLTTTLAALACRGSVGELPAADSGAPADLLDVARRSVAGGSPHALAPRKREGSRSGSRLWSYVQRFAGDANALQDSKYPGLRAQAWHPPGHFPIVSALERAADVIAAEVAALDPSSFQRENERISRTGSWDVLFLYERGRRHDANCARCPATVAVLEAHEIVRTMAGLAYFSRMSPGTHVAPHRGPTNMRVRCHLGVSVPEGDCGIRVGGERRRWEAGRCIVFDDSFEHEAWNATESVRTVLIVDLWHPDLTSEEIAVLEGLHRWAERQATNVQAYWRGNERIANRGTTAP
jgi:hypothetical protein